MCAAAAGAAGHQQAMIVWRLTHRSDTGNLLVSELVTNAVWHARTQATVMWLRLETGGDWLRIEVEDADPRHPQPRTLTGPEESGFGFVLVDARPTSGAPTRRHRQAVWAELDIRETW